MIPLALVAAIDISDLIGIVVVIFIMIVSAVWQWLVRSVQLERRMAKPGQPAPPAQPAERPQERSVDEEVGEFLRRAARRGGPQENPPPRQQVPAAQPPVQAEVIEEAALPEQAGVGRQVTEHVQKYLDTGEFARRGSQLGEEVAQTDAQLGKHLGQVFDHEVGRLAERPGDTAAPPAVDESSLSAADQLPGSSPSAAADLAILLSDIDNVRQAVVLNEILRRPEDRWA